MAVISMLSSTVSSNTLVSHHVGGRGFNVALNCPTIFAGDILHVLYEADPDCAEEMIRTNDRPNYRVLPYCLGESEGTSAFNIMANPYFSSLLAPSPEFTPSTCEVELSGEIDGVPVWGARYDALYGNEMRIVRTESVATHSLDGLFRNAQISADLAPDFLSLDTQGSEPEILLGGRNTISRHVLGISTEVEFAPMYAGQKLFSTIFDFCLEAGFHFAGFSYLQDVLPYHVPVGLRAKGFVSFGDCLFLRRLGTLEAMCESEVDFVVKGMKLAFLAVLFGYLPYALAVLKKVMAVQMPDGWHAAVDRYTYLRFLRDLHAAAAVSSARFLYVDRMALVEERRSRVRRLQPAPESRPRRLLRRALRRLNHSVKSQNMPATPVERLLDQYGFAALAAEVRQRRIAVEPDIPHL
jgi:FkbM family methyltransferase